MGKGIERIALRNFRGATTPVELVFDPKKLVVMLFGENGAGKSTIIDAIDLVCNRSPGSVSDRASTVVRQHLPAIGRACKDIEVRITVGGQQWTGLHTGAAIQVKGPGSAPRAHILRRKQLLRLIEAAPAERYRELQRFIDVGAVERCEDQLKNAVRAAAVRLEERIKLKQAA